MIRLRIERYPEYNGISNPFDETMVEGLTWYENGTPVGRVIIEQWNHLESPLEEIWIPVEVIDE